jgi:hypothetical protein
VGPPDRNDIYSSWSYARDRNSYEVHVQQRLGALQPFGR